MGVRDTGKVRHYRLRQYRLDRRRARHRLKMRVIAFDPFQRRTRQQSGRKVNSIDLLDRADVITCIRR